jgi:hypothetical protein
MVNRFKSFARGSMVLAALVAAIGAASVQAAEIYRAHYEIRVATKNGTDNKVRSTFETRPGQQFTLDLPPNVVVLSVQRLVGESYQLQVTVTPTKPQQGQAVFSHTYQGILGRPLELKTAENAVEVDGAISVVVLDK